MASSTPTQFAAALVRAWPGMSKETRLGYADCAEAETVAALLDIIEAQREALRCAEPYLWRNHDVRAARVMIETVIPALALTDPEEEARLAPGKEGE